MFVHENCSNFIPFQSIFLVLIVVEMTCHEQWASSAPLIYLLSLKAILMDLVCMWVGWGLDGMRSRWDDGWHEDTMYVRINTEYPFSIWKPCWWVLYSGRIRVGWDGWHKDKMYVEINTEYPISIRRVTSHCPRLAVGGSSADAKRFRFEEEGNRASVLVLVIHGRCNQDQSVLVDGIDNK